MDKRGDKRDLLFDPVAIGPKEHTNRFYQRDFEIPVLR
jgi:hypothetical protein